jgi:hypothetical protein
MSGIGIVFPNVQLFDQSGYALAGGKIYTYSAGTTTPTTTWTDSALSVANANPIILDSAGRAVIYVSSTPSLKLIIQDSTGVTLVTQDNVIPASHA